MAKISEGKKAFEENRKRNLRIALGLGLKVYAMGSINYPNAWNLQQEREKEDHIIMTLEGKLFWYKKGFGDAVKFDPAQDSFQAAELCVRYHIGFFPRVQGMWCVTNEWDDHGKPYPTIAEAFAAHVIKKHPWTLKKIRELDKSAGYDGK